MQCCIEVKWYLVYTRLKNLAQIRLQLLAEMGEISKIQRII